MTPTLNVLVVGADIKKLEKNAGSALLPPIGQMVIANVKFTRNWPYRLGGLKITFKEMLVMRIKSSSNSKGWQWSGCKSESFINGDVVSWHCH
jgi:hypothetical protein